jgi:hypothetical protein
MRKKICEIRNVVNIFNYDASSKKLAEFYHFNKKGKEARNLKTVSLHRGS